MSDLRADLDRFYAILGDIETLPGQGRALLEYNGRSRLPARGVYFFREPGEFRGSASSAPRVVRVGTHAVSANSKATLWQRLRTHRGTHAGGGNHRGSIFRLHVGAALLARDDASLPSWGVGTSRSAALRESPSALQAEALLERRVSAHIGAMSVLWVDVPDEPGPSSDRAFIERNAIATAVQPLDPGRAGRRGLVGEAQPERRDPP